MARIKVAVMLLGCALMATAACGELLGLDQETPSNATTPDAEGGASDGSQPQQGDGTAAPGPCVIGTDFEATVPIPEEMPGSINSDLDEQMPRLTPNELVLYFYRIDGSPKLFRAARSTRDAPFGAPTEVHPGLPTRQGFPIDDSETRLYFAQDSFGGNGAYELKVSDKVATPGTPARNVFLTQIELESVSSPFVFKNTLFFGRRLGSTPVQIYRATLNAEGQTEERVMVNISAVDTLDTDPTLSSDGLAIYFYSERNGQPGSIWLATRGAPSDENFAAPVSLAGLRLPGNYTAPGFLSSDNCRLYYYGPPNAQTTSANLYVATRKR